MVDTTAEPKDQEEQLSPSEPKLDAAGPSNLARFSNLKDAGAVAAARKTKTTTTAFKRMSDLTVVRKRKSADSVNAPNKENPQEPEKEQEQQTPPEEQEQPQAEQPNAPETNPEAEAQSPEATPEATPGDVPTDDGRVRNEPEPEKEKPEPEEPEDDQDEDDDDDDLEAAMLDAQAEDQARTKKAQEVTVIAQQKLKEDAEVLAGKEFVSFVWSTVLESLGIGLLWAIPTFDVYILLGLFSKRPLYHQLPKWQIAGILILNVLVFLFIVMLISLVFKTVCTGIVAGTFRKVGSLFSDTAGNIDEVCKQVKPLIEGLPDLGI